MKTFKDLIFKDHAAKPFYHKQAVIIFENGYGASVITGEYAYSSDKKLYEIAVITGTEKDYAINYSTSITDDVIGHLDESEVTEVLIKIQNLK